MGIPDFIKISEMDKYLDSEGSFRIKITFEAISDIKLPYCIQNPGVEAGRASVGFVFRVCFYQ